MSDTTMRPEHQQANSHLEGLADRMEQISAKAAGGNSIGKEAASEILIQALMTIALNMPHEPRRHIARILNAYDLV